MRKYKVITGEYVSAESFNLPWRNKQSWLCICHFTWIFIFLPQFYFPPPPSLLRVELAIDHSGHAAHLKKLSLLSFFWWDLEVLMYGHFWADCGHNHLYYLAAWNIFKTHVNSHPLVWVFFFFKFYIWLIVSFLNRKPWGSGKRGFLRPGVYLYYDGCLAQISVWLSSTKK